MQAQAFLQKEPRAGESVPAEVGPDLMGGAMLSHSLSLGAVPRPDLGQLFSCSAPPHVLQDRDQDQQDRDQDQRRAQVPGVTLRNLH